MLFSIFLSFVFVTLCSVPLESFVFRRNKFIGTSVRHSTSIDEPVCKLEKVLSMFLSNQNLTSEIRQLRFNQATRYRKKPLPSLLSSEDELVLADIVAEPLFCNKTIFFTNVTLSSSLEVFDDEYDALSKNHDLPVFNEMLRKFYSNFTGLPSNDIEIKIQNQNYAFKALMYSELRRKCISIKVYPLDETWALLKKRQHCGEFQPIVDKLFHEKKVKKIGAKKLRALEEARLAAERKEKKRLKALKKKNNPYKPKPKPAPAETTADKDDDN